MARKTRNSPNPGLTPPDLLKQIRAEVANEDLPKMQSKSEAKRRSVLHTARPSGADETSGSRVFGATSVSDAGRTDSSEPPAVSDALGLESEIALSDIVRQVMLSPGPEEGVSFLRQMVTQVALKAARGEQWAVDFIANRYEGKPGQAPRKTTSIEQAEETINEVEVATLNDLLDTE